MNGRRVFLVGIFLVSVCRAERLPVVRGHVESEKVIFGGEFAVELESQGRATPTLESSVAGDGSFEFRDVPQGVYELRLTSNRGAVLAEQLVDLVSYAGQLSIHVPKATGARPVSGTISVGQLQHSVSPKAFRAFAEAEREAEAGHRQEAVRKLQRALRADPGFSDARCNLGVEYVRLGRFPEAYEEFQKAAATGPPSATLFGNLAFSLIALGRAREAEQAARRAIALDASYGRGHYLLGNILAKSVRPNLLQNAAEAARELRLGAASLPHAHIVIAQMYLDEGDKPSAAEELRLYLQSGDKGYRTGVERSLAILTGH